MAGHKYGNPPIEEATCQFTLAEPISWDATTPGKIFDGLKDRYPGMPAQQQLLQANLAPGMGADSPTLALSSNERVVFISDDGSDRLSVGPTMIGLHRGRPYIGFEEELLPRIQRDLPRVFEVVGHAPIFLGYVPTISSISVRYVNKIVINEASFDLSEYFLYWGAEASALPESFDGTIVGFFYRTAAKRINQPENLSLTFASADAPKDSASFILDIDLTHTFDSSVEVHEAIDKLIDLKVLENSIFESLITDKSRDLFQ